MADFGYCADCNEICYSLPTKNGVFTQANVAMNHHNCGRYMNFDKPPGEYPPPVAQVLKKLNAGLLVSDNEIVLFKLALQLHDFAAQDGGAKHGAGASRHEAGAH